MSYYPLLRRLLFYLPPERAHYLALNLLKYTHPHWWTQWRLARLPQHPVEVCGLQFPNPVGLAAGYDKNGDYIDALFSLGFGHLEVGTVTPKPQVGNPQPRLFRLPQAQALINRMGFNNLGVDHLVTRLRQRRVAGIIGVNIGKNKATPLAQAADDYCYCLTQVYPYADYVAINISSPNTPGLRELQSKQYLHDFLTEIARTRQQLAEQSQREVPMLVKIDPDLDRQALETLLKTIVDHPIAGMIATNSSVDHSAVAHLRDAQEAGGLSGAPLYDRSTQVVKQLHDILAGQLPIIAVGGIMSAQDAINKLAAGASLVQVYTGLIYQGPGLPRAILNGLSPSSRPMTLG